MTTVASAPQTAHQRVLNANNLTRLLVPLDFSECSLNALAYAVALARKVNAELTLYHGYHVVADSDLAPIAASYVGQQMDQQQKLWQDRLDELAAQLRQQTYEFSNAPLKVHTIAKMGLVVDDVADLVGEEGFGLVVMGTKGSSGLEKILFGSVTAAVIDRVKIPVLAIPKDCRFQQLDHIVYGTNFDAKDIQVIDDLLELANAFDARITALHVSTTDAELTNDQQEIESLRDTYWFTPVERLDFQLRREESAQKGLEHYLQEHQTDLLAVLRQNRTFLERLLERSVSRGLAFHCQVPLLILRK
jgi:nucleotide-binding universal stress UspA family protein